MISAMRASFFRCSAPGMPPGSAIMSNSCSARAASGVSAASRMPCEPVTGLPASDATTTSMPARRSTSMIVTASSSSNPSASGTSTRFIGR